MYKMRKEIQERSRTTGSQSYRTCILTQFIHKKIWNPQIIRIVESSSEFMLLQIVHQDDYILDEAANPPCYNKSVRKCHIYFFHMVYWYIYKIPFWSLTSSNILLSSCIVIISGIFIKNSFTLFLFHWQR